MAVSFAGIFFIFLIIIFYFFTVNLSGIIGFIKGAGNGIASNISSDSNSKMIKVSKYRLKSSQFFFTWPKLGMPLEEVLKQLKEIFTHDGVEISRYLICNELHLDGTPHRHAYIKLNRTIDAKDARFADLIWKEETYHGNYQGCRSEKGVVQYCMKKDDFICNFDFNLDANTRKLRRNKQLERLVTGETPLHIMVKEEDYSLLKGYRTLKQDLTEYELDSYKKSLRDVEAIWFYGKTRRGKSWLALEHMGIDPRDPEQLNLVFEKNGRNKWFDGYNGQTKVLMDEVAPGKDSQWLMDYLKKWTDRLPCSIESKGRTMHGKWTQWMVTSQHSIDDVFGLPEHHEDHKQRLKDIAALKQRFKEIRVKRFLYGPKKGQLTESDSDDPEENELIKDRYE